MTQVRLTASKLQGTAPMAVHFDAVNTTDLTVGDPFRELRHDFNFGDPNSGAWATSGKSKNTESGAPLAAHVYDNPGTYAVTVEAGDSFAQITIEVADPDIAWAGNTICLSTNNDFSGAPSGSIQIGNITRWPVWESNKRYLLHAGQNFNSLGELYLDLVEGVRVSAFGEGAKPLVANVTLQNVKKPHLSDKHPTTGDPWIKNIDVIGLDLQNIFQEGSASEIFIYQNDINTTNPAWGEIRIASGLDNFAATHYPNMYMPYNIFVIENNATGSNYYGAHTGEGQMSWLGNNFGYTDEHNVRWWQAYKSVFSHNNLVGYSLKSGKANFKIHGKGFDRITNPAQLITASNVGTASTWVVASHNTFNSPGSTNIWSTFTIKPQDRVVQEGLEYIIAEFNTHIKGVGSTNAGAFAGREITRRGEIHGAGVGCPSVGHLQESLPLEWQGPYNMPGPCAQDEPLPIAPGGAAPPIDPPMVCDEGYELIDGECVEIPPIDPPTEPCTCVDGAQGVQGIQGIQGVQGLPGADGNDAEMDPLMDEALDFYDYVKAYFQP